VPADVTAAAGAREVRPVWDPLLPAPGRPQFVTRFRSSAATARRRRLARL